MSYSPVELRHVHVARGVLGYKRADVERILAEVADSFEQVWRERGELAEKIDQLEDQVTELKRSEHTLTHTLVAAEQTANEVRNQAKRQAELILAEAHQEARSVTRTAQGERERLFAETRRIEALLRAALGMVEETGIAGAPKQAEVEEVAALPAAPETFPVARPDDTREFEPIVFPVPESAQAESVPVEEKTEEGRSYPFLRRVAGGDDAREFDWGE